MLESLLLWEPTELILCNLGLLKRSLGRRALPAATPPSTRAAARWIDGRLDGTMSMIQITIALLYSRIRTVRGHVPHDCLTGRLFEPRGLLLADCLSSISEVQDVLKPLQNERVHDQRDHERPTMRP